MTLHIRPTSPYLSKPLRSEAEARAERLERVARRVVSDMPRMTGDLVKGETVYWPYIANHFRWMWERGV